MLQEIKTPGSFTPRRFPDHPKPSCESPRLARGRFDPPAEHVASPSCGKLPRGTAEAQEQHSPVGLPLSEGLFSSQIIPKISRERKEIPQRLPVSSERFPLTIPVSRLTAIPV